MSEYQGLPADDASPQTLLEDAKDYFRGAVPGWEPSDGAPEVALLAAGADEGATLYALVDDAAEDRFRDFGRTVLGIPADEPAPAEALTTWVARGPAPVGGWTLNAGVTLAATSPAGRFGFEVIDTHVLAEGGSSLTAVRVRALLDGEDANGATGAADLDDPPAWVASASLTSPASGGRAGEDDDAYLDKILRGARQLHRSPVLSGDLELAAQEVDGIARTLVRDNWDETTLTGGHARTASLFPVDANGAAVDEPRRDALAALLEARREPNWRFRIGEPTDNPVNAYVKVSRRSAEVDVGELDAAVEAAVASGPLNPARHGDTQSGERSRFLLRRWIRQYEVAAAADAVVGVDSVIEVRLALDPANTGVTPTDTDLEMVGSAPLPSARDIVVEVVDPT
ncbi:MAG: baseplate J/gp47 family protein [Patulibacter minatonensis]